MSALDGSGITAKNIGFSDIQERCPVFGCGRWMQVMEGVYDFDSDGIATAISAPQWSRDALGAIQGELRDAARALADPNYSDDRAYTLLDGKLDRLLAKHEETDAKVAGLVHEIQDLKKKVSRGRLASIIAGVAFTVGLIADLQATIQLGTDTFEFVNDVIHWAASLFEQGQEPRASDVPFPMPSPETEPAP